MKRYIATFTGVVIFAGLGYYAAKVNIWWYHLESTQAAVATWAYPIILGLAGGVFAFRVMTDDKAGQPPT